ncbi:acyl-CoA dehydrogenase family protein [Microbacterium ginsengisoli]|uniref:acyl-CoA dehydrogenase family protein n=1 Tax=Microbacterium ginsengisoli TaxID=400772 RepID=UPI001FDFC0BA|nr:acyl-CoA dehydrogenase family protein [Microbacterium ginsengisoli]
MQKQQWLPRPAEGDVASFALMEPGAGSDPAGLRTTATRDGDDWSSRGQAFVGDERTGYRAAMTSLARGRVHIEALAVGSAQRALDESVSYAATATQGGTPIGDFQLVQAMLADQQTGVMAGRALVREAPRLYVTGEDQRIAPSVAKLFCTEMVGKVADLAVQVHGGAGYMREVAVERIYRDVRLLRLHGGTSEIQRLIIGGGLIRSAKRTV